MFNIDNITRKNIRELTPYSSAREEFSGQATILLDANENPYDTELNRYPDPFQQELKNAIAQLKNINSNQLFIGNGSDEAIDLLFRAFCEPNNSKAFIFPPTYGMYEVSAQINDIEIVRLPLGPDFQLPDLETIKDEIKSTGLLFICSPNNPTGTVYGLEQIKAIADCFYGLVVVDEAYIDFSDSESALSLLDSTPNLVVLQTMSKAYGLAGLRLGIAAASKEIIQVLNKIKPPYNVNTLSQTKGLEAIKNRSTVQEQIKKIKDQREALSTGLQSIKGVKKVYPSQANFILAEFENAVSVFKELQNKGIIIRNRTSLIKDGLRITVGTPQQNETLIDTLKNITP